MEIRGSWAKDSFHFQKTIIDKIDFVTFDYDRGCDTFESDGFLGLGFSQDTDGQIMKHN